MSLGERSWGRLFSVMGPFLILAFVSGLFVLLLWWRDSASDGDAGVLESFLSIRSVKIILIQTVIIALCALGMTMIIVSGGIDLSVGSAVALTSVLGAVFIRDQGDLTWVIVSTVLAGGVIGLVNGSLIAAFRMPPFIVTLGMLGVARGLAKWLANNQAVNFPASPVALLVRDPNPDKLWPPWAVVMTIGLAAFMAFVMRQTVFGRHVFALGSNEATARLCGLATRRLKLLIYGLAGLFFGLGGLVQLSRLRQGDPTAAVGLELDVIAAVVIGGASLNGGTGSILGSMIGALTMAVLRTGSQYMDWPTYTQEIIIGVLIVLAVGLDKVRQARLTKTF